MKASLVTGEVIATEVDEDLISKFDTESNKKKYLSILKC